MGLPPLPGRDAAGGVAARGGPRGCRKVRKTLDGTDAFKENVFCEIELKHARVMLSFGVFSAVPEEHPGEQVCRRPSIVALQATMIDDDRGLAVWSDNGWIWTAE